MIAWIIQTLGRRDLSGCFLVHICVFYSHIHHILHFCVPRPKFLEPKWSHIIPVFQTPMTYA